MEYTNRPVRRAKAEYLNAQYPDTPPNGCILTLGTTSYCYEGGKWFTMVPVREKKPPFMACTVYGNFTVPHTGHNFVAVKYPTKSNWNRAIAPALYRMLKRVAGASRKDVMGTDAISYERNADQVKVFKALKGPAKFEFRAGEFVCVWKGTKKK